MKPRVNGQKSIRSIPFSTPPHPAPPFDFPLARLLSFRLFCSSLRVPIHTPLALPRFRFMSTATLPVPLFASSIQTTDPYGKPFETSNLTDSRSIVFVDLDNVVYSKTTRIAEKMGVLIKSYFLQIGLEEVEANALHMKYYSEYGLAIRGLVKHHKVDPLHYDLNCDSALPVSLISHPNSD